ncbi:CD48 antigen-like [Paramisgurnus dabryanus]|uniref:CD48 antigen-like n=1 Tax=Paramisgurnus dabryanus TaxID=90735 RepID=UPI0031F372CB
MKMSRGCGYMLLLVVLFIAVVSGVVGVVRKKVGDEARFQSDKTALKDSSITWKYSAGGEVIKVVEWDNDFQTEEILNPKFKNRVALDRNNGELTIRNLQLGDTGSYSIEINNKEEKKISLIVKEGVNNPKLEHEETKENPDVIYLNCNIIPISQYNENINWTCSEGKNPFILNPGKGKQGESITISRTKNPDVCCNCTLFNEVDEKTSNTLCIKDLPASSGGLGVGAIFGIVITVIFIIIILFVLYYFHDCIYRFVREQYQKIIRWFNGGEESDTDAGKNNGIGADRDPQAGVPLASQTSN